MQRRGDIQGLPKQKFPWIVPFPEVLGDSLPPGLVPVPALAASVSPGNSQGGYVLEMPHILPGLVLSGKAQGWVATLPSATSGCHLQTLGHVVGDAEGCQGWREHVPGPCKKSCHGGH